MKKYVIATLATALAMHGAFWLFNHVNAWLGIAGICIVGWFVGNFVRKEAKKICRDEEKENEE